jgi:hypothetical protein
MRYFSNPVIKIGAHETGKPYFSHTKHQHLHFSQNSMQDNNSLNAYEVHKFMSKMDILVAFTGHFDHQMITILLKNIRGKLKTTSPEMAIEQKVYCILVECVENVSKYSSGNEDSSRNGMFMLCKSDTKYTVITGNPMLNKDIPSLKTKLDNVSKMSREELKQLYRQQIMSERETENNAGLGIIDIALKSGNQFHYNFKPLTETTSFYHFQTEIEINS